MGAMSAPYQEEDFDQAAIHFLHSGFPPCPFPLCFNQLAALQQNHGAVGVGRDVLLNEIPAGNVLNIFPGLLHCWGKEERKRKEFWQKAFSFFQGDCSRWILTQQPNRHSSATISCN